jgi:hypothetical protein
VTCRAVAGLPLHARLSLRRLPARLLLEQLSQARCETGPAPPVSPSVQPTRPATANVPSMTASGSRHEGPHPRREATMSTGEHNQLISGLVEAVWNQHNTAAIGRYFSPGLELGLP